MMYTLANRNHPCTGCEQAPGGCKHRCNKYREYETMVHEKVYPERAERRNGLLAENGVIYASWHREMRRSAMGRGLRPGYVR